MFGWLVKLFRYFIPDFNAREVSRLTPILEEVNDKEEYYSGLTDAELASMTTRFRTKLLEGETLDDIKADAFAAVREAGKRTLNMRHFDVQIIGGLALHDGRIVEMKTGEGKTLVATLPLYINALELNPAWVELANERGLKVFEPIFDEKKGVLVPVGRGAVLVTVNDYLARRDSVWMGNIFKFLGMTVGLNVHGLSAEEKRAAYGADITYGTNNEFGFDYLRDNMALSVAECVQRPEYNFAIVDEVDSILIDEARTPLIISGPAEKATNLYFVFAKIARENLKPEVDYIIDEKHHGVSVTEAGIAAVEKVLGVNNLYENKNIDLVHQLQNALKAKHFFHIDQEYVVKEREDKTKEVIIVDEFTGRLMFGRRYSDGLHQAIEAKEGVPIQQENQTLASITFQNYFRLYRKLSGMTGTAETEAREFKEIYNCEVVVIPSNRPLIRSDLSDIIYKTVEEKFEAIVEHIIEIHQQKQPILVGTISIEKSELIAAMLRKRGFECQVLNAKYHEKEAEIVSQAGREAAITIATNMAGRGTDILLGGNPEMLALAEVPNRESDEFPPALEKYKQLCASEKERVIKAGGLFILGTERHEARRIDNQLRGRAGRQGDPGASQFYLSLEDELMRLFGSINIAGWMEKLGWEKGTPIEHPWISRSIENAQKKVEAHHFEIRKHVLKYDDVMNQQRTMIYKERRKALEQDLIHEDVVEMVEESLKTILDRHLNPEIEPEEWDMNALKENLLTIFPIEITVEELTKYSREELDEELATRINQRLEAKRKEMGDEDFYRLEKFLLLQMVDAKWKDHLYNMDNLHEGIHLRSWGQRDPLVEYKIEGFQMFTDMVDSIKEDVLTYLFRMQFSVSEEREAVEKKEQEIYYNRGDEDEAKKAPKKAAAKTGRNDPCPCGSGRKYKKCCGMYE